MLTLTNTQIFYLASMMSKSMIAPSASRPATSSGSPMSTSLHKPAAPPAAKTRTPSARSAVPKPKIAEQQKKSNSPRAAESVKKPDENPETKKSGPTPKPRLKPSAAFMAAHQKNVASLKGQTENVEPIQGNKKVQVRN